MKYFKIIFSVFIWIVIGVCAVISLINLCFFVSKNILGNKVPMVFGYSYQVGLNYSMQPTLMPNDFLITKKFSSYNVGDIISFIDESDGKIITHTIVELTLDGYITRGDSPAVTTNDAEVKNENIIGKVVVVFHFLGAFFRILVNPIGFVLLLAIIFVLLLIIRTLRSAE